MDVTASEQYRLAHGYHRRRTVLLHNITAHTVMVSMSGGAWSEFSRGAAVKHFVVAALWYFLRGAALQHLSSGGGCFDIFVGAT